MRRCRVPHATVLAAKVCGGGRWTPAGSRTLAGRCWLAPGAQSTYCTPSAFPETRMSSSSTHSARRYIRAGDYSAQPQPTSGVACTASSDGDESATHPRPDSARNCAERTRERGWASARFVTSSRPPPQDGTLGCGGPSSHLSLSPPP